MNKQRYPYSFFHEGTLLFYVRSGSKREELKETVRVLSGFLSPLSLRNEKKWSKQNGLPSSRTRKGERKRLLRNGKEKKRWSIFHGKGNEDVLCRQPRTGSRGVFNERKRRETLRGRRRKDIREKHLRPVIPIWNKTPAWTFLSFPFFLLFYLYKNWILHKLKEAISFFSVFLWSEEKHKAKSNEPFFIWYFLFLDRSRENRMHTRT